MVNWQVRKAAAQALQKILDIQVMPKLIQALTDEYADVRKEAVIALGNLAHLHQQGGFCKNCDSYRLKLRLSHLTQLLLKLVIL
ncbi:HEAT repeat domain-containing protein [Komarekiella delphini-convector]|uniref:HEAT repeat domain-containing protein n=1 Tax=Komarekiella delphini-convector TaxID=3050158 RepID=UPI00177B5C37|nr:HEAT repeat domain-containing protein [Komarekiella delphini-convector]